MVYEQLPLPIRFDIGPREADGDRGGGATFRFALDSIRPPDYPCIADNPVLRVVWSHRKGFHRPWRIAPPLL